MTSPLTVGATPIVAIPVNLKRVAVRFQNNGNTDLYITRQVGITPNVPSATNFDVFLAKPTGGEANEAVFTTNSVAQFNVVSSGANGSLAVFETTRTNI